MKISILMSLIVIVCLVPTAYSMFDLSLFGSVDIPIGAFSQEEDIIETSIPGRSYTAKGGGAEGGIGLGFDFGMRVHKRVRVGGNFGYSRLNADATDVCEKIVKPLLPSIGGVQSEWVMRYVGLLTSIDAVRTRHLNFYGRFGAGVVRVRNEIDLQSMLGKMSTEFDLRNQFYLSFGFGFQSLLAQNVAFVGEIVFNQIFSDGAEASASLGFLGSTYKLHGVQGFDMQLTTIRFGVRMNLGR